MHIHARACMEDVRSAGELSFLLIACWVLAAAHYSCEGRGEPGNSSAPPSSPLLSYPYDDADAEGRDPDLAGRARDRTMSASSSKPPRHHLRLHVGNTSATAATTTNNGSAAASPGSASSSHSPRTPRPAPAAAAAAAGGGGVVNPACAACKYQRRKCSVDCPLAPYFPADQQRRFINAHRLFGVSNIQKTLRRIEPKFGPDAMRALIYQSEARAADPVGGCVGIIEELRRQIHNTEQELAYVRQHIAICRAAAAASSAPTAGTAMAGQQDTIVAVDALYAGQQPIIPPEGSGLIFHDQQDDHHVVKVEDPSKSYHQQLYDYYYYNNGTAGDEATSEDGGMQQYGFADVDSGVKEAGSPVDLGEQLGQHCKIGALPFVDAFNMKPQHVLPPAIMQHHGPAAAGDVLHPEQKKLAATPVLMKHDDVDEYMEEQQATAGAPCHLELGFSSSF